MGTQPCLSQPSKPSRWLTLALGWDSFPGILSYAAPAFSPQPAQAPSLSEVPHKLFPFAFPSHSSPARSSLQAQGDLSCQHISGCICCAPAALRVCRPLLNSPGGQHCSGSEQGSLRSTGILYGIIPLFVKLSLPSFHKSFQFPFHTDAAPCLSC